MKLKMGFFFTLALAAGSFAGANLVVKGNVQKAKAATFVPSGEKWIDDLARYDNRQMWLALKSSDYKMVLQETRSFPSAKMIVQTLQYKANPKSNEVLALKTLFKKRFCSGFLTSELRENGLSKSLRFVDADGMILNRATLSVKICEKFQ